MAVFAYQPEALYQLLTDPGKFLLLDVRNAQDFNRFKIEGPHPVDMMNISYFDFMEIEDECIARLPSKDTKIRIVCAKEGSAQFVAEILDRRGFTDVAYLAGGIKSWDNFLVPKLINPGGTYQLYQFIRPGKRSCSYGLVHNFKMILFDPTKNIQFYLDLIDDLNCRIIKTVETHLQSDYISGSLMISEQTGARFYGSEADFLNANIDYAAVKDGENIGFGETGPTVRVIHAPGHTPGSVMYLIDETYLISGDTVFIQSIGRPDLSGKVEQWSKALFSTIRAVAAMDEALIVLPAHFITWDEANSETIIGDSLGKIKARNEAIYSLEDVSLFLDYIKANIREQPAEYSTIRKVNANLQHVGDEEAEILDLGKNECAASAYAT